MTRYSWIVCYSAAVEFASGDWWSAPLAETDYYGDWNDLDEMMLRAGPRHQPNSKKVDLKKQKHIVP